MILVVFQLRAKVSFLSEKTFMSTKSNGTIEEKTKIRLTLILLLAENCNICMRIIFLIDNTTLLFQSSVVTR